jgi:nucleoid-associated protein YgaU
MEDAVVAGSVSMLDTILTLASDEVPGRFVRIDDPSCPDREVPDHEGPELHVVQPGEWLSTIAEEHYGDPMRYDVLFGANTDRIEGFDDPDQIEPGWALEVPELDTPLR